MSERSKLGSPFGLLVLVLILVNLGIGAAPLLIYVRIAPFVAGPVEWATGRRLGGADEILLYPGILTWALPIFLALWMWALRQRGSIGGALQIGLISSIYPAVVVGFNLHH